MKVCNSLSVLLWGLAIALSLPQATFAQEKAQEIAKASDLPVVESATLHPNLSVPWSKPVQVMDPFEGNFIAVFDRDRLGRKYGGDRRVISVWSRDTIRVLLNVQQRRCNGYHSWHSLGSGCIRVDNLRVVQKLLIRVGGEILALTGENGVFAVDDAISTALKNAPEEDLTLRLVVEGGERIDSEIGKKTVKAWQVIYGRPQS